MMYKPQSIYTETALNTIISYITKRDIVKTDIEKIPSELKTPKACFVTIHRNDGSLRGCIGTLSPQRDNLYEEIVHNSISAATRDSRFNPLTPGELEDITISVSVLSEPYPIMDFDELDPKQKGLIVRYDNRTQAVLLPNIKGIDTVEDQVYKLKKKGGIEDIDDKYLEYFAFTTEEYH